MFRFGHWLSNVYSTAYMALCSWSNVKMFLKMMVVESHIIVVYARTVFTSVESEAQF